MRQKSPVFTKKMELTETYKELKHVTRVHSVRIFSFAKYHIWKLKQFVCECTIRIISSYTFQPLWVYGSKCNEQINHSHKFLLFFKKLWWGVSK